MSEKDKLLKEAARLLVQVEDEGQEYEEACHELAKEIRELFVARKVYKN